MLTTRHKEGRGVNCAFLSSAVHTDLPTFILVWKAISHLCSWKMLTQYSHRISRSASWWSQQISHNRFFVDRDETLVLDTIYKNVCLSLLTFTCAQLGVHVMSVAFLVIQFTPMTSTKKHAYYKEPRDEGFRFHTFKGHAVTECWWPDFYRSCSNWGVFATKGACEGFSPSVFFF